MHRCLSLGLLAVAGALASARGAPAAELARPNFVFVLVDDMGYADIGCMGAKDIRTPHIDRLAREGLLFTDFYANAPVCTPTRAGFMTGRWQQRVGLEWALGFTAEQQVKAGERWVSEPDTKKLGLPPSEVTLARMLGDAGYRCGAFGKWHLGFRPEHNPIRHGFHEYFGVLLGHSDFYSYSYKDGTYNLMEGEKPTTARGYLTDLLNQRAAAFVRKNARKPFFLYVPHLALHFPFQVPDRPNQKLTEENIYDGTRRDYALMLERVDQGVGMIRAALEEEGVLDNTMFIFSSDNGGERLSDNSPLFHSKTTLWEGGIRVPCLIRWPARLAQGKRVSQPAITMDLTATILAAAGVKPPEGRRLDGIDLMPILTGRQPPVERTFCWRVQRSGKSQKAIRHGKWKHVQDGMIPLLYDLEADVGERHNLAWKHPEVLARLRRLLDAWEKEMDASPRTFVVR